jgi:FkbM family methyltransferase
MIILNRISEDYKIIHYMNVSDRVIPVIIMVYDCYTDTLIFTNELDMEPNIGYYTYMPQAWKNRRVMIHHKITNELLLPLWIDGIVSISDIDKFGYIKKLFKEESNKDLQLAIHATLSEHFMDKKYGGYVDVEEGDVVIDIGFNYGVFTLRSLNNGASKVYGFEPNIDAYKISKKVYTDKNKVEVFNFAVGGKNGKVTMKQSISSLTSSTFGDVEDYKTSYDVDCINITDFMFFHKINKVDFMKIDCEGSEYEIFESIPDEMFSTIKKIHVEYHYNDGEKVKPIIDKLNRNNFEWKFDEGSNENSVIGMIYAKQKK